MIAEERRSYLLRELHLRGTVSVLRFAESTGVSRMTVRRDLALLEEQGLLVRVHGGAVPVRHNGHAPHGRATPGSPLLTLGVVLPSSGYYYPAVLRGAQEAAGTLGARLVLGISSYDAAVEAAQIERLAAGGVDGLLVTPSAPFDEDSSTYRLLAGRPVPAMLMEREVTAADPRLMLESVRSDHGHGAELAVSHLVRGGDERIAFLWRNSPTAEQVRAGFHRACRALAPDGFATDFEIPGAAAEGGVALARLREVLRACLAQDVRAVLVLPDEAAIAFADLVHDQGLGVPEDLRIIAYDDELASLARVPLTAVAPPKQDVGRLAATRCVERITARGSGRTTGSAPARTSLLPTLVRRQSA